MIELLEPLSKIPGVRLAGLITQDGVPVAIPGADAEEAAAGPVVDVDALAAVASHWLSEITRDVAAMTWPAPRRAMLTAARGSLVLVEGPNSVLIALTEAGVDHEELRLQMDAAVARISRNLRSLADRAELNRTPPPMPKRQASEIDTSNPDH